MGNAYIENMMIGPDGALWIVENINTYYYDLPENFDPMTQNTWEYYKEDKNFTQVRKLNADGSEAAVLNLSEIAASLDSAYDEENPRTYYIYNSVLDSAGNLYFYFYGNDGGMMVVVNSQGEVLFTLKEDNVGGEMVRLSDGRVAVMCYGEEAEMRPINVEEQDWDEGVTLPTDWYGFYTGADDFLYFYSTSSSVMGCKEDGTIEKLFTWINCDMNQDELRGISVSSLDQVVAIQTDWSGEQPISELVVLNRTEVTPENQRKTLTMAVMWMDYDLRNEVLDYNRNNTEYRIEVQDYSEYNTQDDYQAGLTKLSTEIISGKVPDIMVVDNLPIRQYGAKGLLEDLLPYIEADEELGGREGLVQPVLNAMLQDGKLYQICSTFSVNTATTSQKLAGDVTGWYEENGRTYYVQDGVRPLGFFQVDGITYYQGEDGFLSTGWVEIEGERCYFNINGSMVTGWLQQPEGTYYMGMDGTMAIGWVDIDGQTYYFKADGLMVTGVQVINGVKYYFGVNGALIRKAPTNNESQVKPSVSTTFSR
jgi:hypothetical protein